LTIRSTRDLDDLVNRGYRFALSLTHDVARAEDLTQDAWFAILRCRGPWSREYLFTTIRNRFIDEYRRDKRVEVEPLEGHAEVEAGPDPQDWDVGSPFAATNGLFDEALGHLNPDERAVLYLAAVEEYTAQQIANLLDRPRGTVLSTIHRARGKLRKLMATDSRATA
jgi:RNA polymerase sigma-70 factor (ECF subfamily)